MKKLSKSAGLILLSLFFAGLILLFSFLLKEAEYADTVTFLLIAIWFVPFSILLAQKD